MNDILREYLKYLNEAILRCEEIVEKYSLVECLTLNERKRIFEVIVHFENLRLWGKSVLYGENDQPYNENSNCSSEVHNIKEILTAKLGLGNLTESELELGDEQVFVVSRRELPMLCCLTRETFSYPVSHRYENSDKTLNICRNHVFEKEAILKYLGNCKKKACPIVGCGYLVVKKYLRKDKEIAERIFESRVKREQI
ncbi:hypothetical protein FG386_002643 [Cryptosporidium ryanae]|uniref:uncharacterized protein n=1 Tax=Cryptosporidium ryanae TaxID=515981 RepID=UPI00351A56E1|nr:hypothetical protein FG386_002643 [Cryptosporidium ryanae]